MNTKKILASFLVVLFVASLGAVAVSAALTFSGIPDVAFDEDTSDSTLDLDDYASGAVGTVTYDYSGNTNIYVTIAADGIVTFTAKADWNGNEDITFEAPDDNGTPTNSADDTVITDISTVTVNPVNDAPVLTITDLKAYEDVAFTYDVSDVTEDVDGDSIEYLASTTWATFVMDAAGKISFTPTSDDTGRHKVTFTVKDTKSETATKTIDFIVTESTDDGSLLITDVEVDDETGDDDELLPGDMLEVEFDLNNELTALDLEDIKVELWIEDETGDKVSDEVESEKVDIEADEDESMTMNIRIPLDLDADDYVLVINAAGEDEDGNAKTNVFFEDIDVERNSHDLLIDTVKLNPTEAQPGGSLEFAVYLYNIGNDEEDEVRVEIKNSELDISKMSDIFELEESGSDADVVKKLVVDIPSTASAGEYQFEVLVTYNEGDDERTSFVPVTVAGETAGDAAINIAEASASARPGQTIKFPITLKNTATSTIDYTVVVSGVENWASASVEPATISLAAGSEMPVFVYVTPKEGTTGDYTATINVMSGDTTLATQTLSVGVLAATTSITGFGTQLGAITSDTNTLAFAVIIIVLVIVAIGLFVARTRAKVEVYGKKRR